LGRRCFQADKANARGFTAPAIEAKRFKTPFLAAFDIFLEVIE
jgi:hypothetical protein